MCGFDAAAGRRVEEGRATAVTSGISLALPSPRDAYGDRAVAMRPLMEHEAIPGAGMVRDGGVVIFPGLRATFGESEARWLLGVLSGAGDGCDDQRPAELCHEGIDALLDDRRTLDAVLGDATPVTAPPGLVVYVMVRHTLLEHSIESPELADYVAALVLEFGNGRRSFRVDRDADREYRYLVDILQDLAGSGGRRAFLLRVHLGNYSLWLSGLFPDYVTHRERRRGAPGLDYFEEMGRSGYLMAANDPHAGVASLDILFRDVARAFGPLRRALNEFSDRYLLPRPASPVDRLIRQVENGLQPGLET